MKKGDPSKLSKFFNPRTIAVIGASPHKEKVGGVLMEKLQSFKGEIIPINPSYKEILEKTCYPSVKNYKKKIDLGIIAIPAPLVPNTLIECGKKKIKNIIIISAGFAEKGNIKLENELLRIAKKFKIKILGPNCFGIVNTSLGLDCTFANSTPQRGTTAFISQSGALWSYISDFSKIKISNFVSLGNQSMLGFSEFIEYFNQDSRTRKIILYIERLKQGKRFIEICRKSKKPIVVIKAGQTKKGTEATLLHTGSIATDFRIYKGAFKQAKIRLKETLAEAFGIYPEKINLKNKKIKEVKIIGNAGGAIALLTDQLVQKGIKVTSKDLLGTALAKDYQKELKKNFKGQTIVVITPQKMSQPKEIAKLLKKKDIAIFLGKNSMKEAKKILKTKKITYYNKVI